MTDLLDSLYFEDGFSIRLNDDTNDMFVLIDYGSRIYPMNMANQHFHDFYEIFIPLEDGAAHLMNGRYVPLQKGDIVLIQPQRLHMSIYPRSGEPQKRIIINYANKGTIPGLDYQLGKIRALYEAEEPVLRLRPEQMSALIKRLNALFVAGKSKSTGWQLEVYSLFMLFLLEILRCSKRSIYAPEKNHPGLPDMKMYAIAEYIDTHYMEPITLQDVSEKFAISPFYLSHQFTRVMGLSFVSYVQKIRIRYALHMLSYTGARIHDIIAGCGFSSASQFNRTFYSLCQMSPSAFRKLDSKDREVVISSLDPERSEAVPSAFPPRYRVVLRKAGNGCIPGVRADILSPSDLESLKENLALIGAETLLLDIPSCFPQCRSYRRLTDRKLAEIADAGLDISVIGVSGVDIGSPDASEREEAMEECRAALHASAALSAPIVCIHPSKGRYAPFMESLCELSAEAEALGIMVSTVPIPGTSVDGIDGAVELIGDAPDVRLLLDPAALVDEDGRNNTFSFFEKVFSLAGPSIAALLLNDRLDGHAVGLGRGIMAKTYPRIASLIGCSMPLIRVGTEATSAIEDMDYIRRTFL